MVVMEQVEEEIVLTPPGRLKMEEELERLITVDRPEVAARIRFRHESALYNGQERWLARLKVFRLAKRVGDDQAMASISQSLSESLEQGGIPAGEKDHGLSLGRREEPVKGRDRCGLNFYDLIS